MTIATTNYDGLLEEPTGGDEATRLRPVTWRDGARVERLMRGDEKGILHLHGYWEDPASVVLGIRSYEAVLDDEHAQGIQHALRTLRTLVFVGFGAGLHDPNFGALLAWSREVFASSEYRHFRLCLETEERDLLALHPAAERLEPVVYGKTHAELAPFLRNLRQEASATAVRDTQGNQAQTQKELGSVARLPAPRNCFGRKDALRQLVRAVVAPTPDATAILGPPGVGKTTVALAVLHDAKVADRYGARRFFVRCDAATGRDAVVAAMASAIALEPGPGLEQRTYRELESGPALLVLDNVETPWDADQLPVEELLGQLAASPALALLVTKRGEERPVGPRWREPVLLRPLDLVPARKAFLEVAGYHLRKDPLLDRLIEAVDALPIAIDLLAHDAQSLSDLAELWQRWETAVLQRAGGRTREVNIVISVRLSLESPRMSPAGWRLASLLALLPGGLSPDHLRAIFADDGAEAVAALRRTGLVAPQEVRLRLLAPIREAMRYLPSPRQKDRQRLVQDRKQLAERYLDLARHGEQVGHEGGADAAAKLAAELGNLEAMIAIALQESDPRDGVAAAVALGNFQEFTGLGGFELLSQARNAARKAGNTRLEAESLKALADLAASRSKFEMARPRIEEACALYQRLSDLEGEADCVWRLGDIARLQSDYQTATSHFENARRLYHQVGSVGGEASCIESLGYIAFELSDYQMARSLYEEALPLYRDIGDPQGEANCISGLGHIALQNAEYEMAGSRYEAALPLFRRIGDPLAGCGKNGPCVPDSRPLKGEEGIGGQA